MSEGSTGVTGPGEKKVGGKVEQKPLYLLVDGKEDKIVTESRFFE
jgi:hypothetical protein